MRPPCLSQMRHVKIPDDGAEIGPNRGKPDLTRRRPEPDEGVGREVVGKRPIAGQPDRESMHRRRVRLVDLVKIHDPSGGLRAKSGLVTCPQAAARSPQDRDRAPGLRTADYGLRR